MLRLLRFLTVDQWRMIDRQYRSQSGFDGKGAVVLISAAVILVLNAYVGKTRFIYGIPAARELFSGLAHPGVAYMYYWALFRIVSYVLLPAVVIRLVFRERVRDYGIRIETARKVVVLYVCMFIAVFPLVYLVSHSPAFLQKYPFFKEASRSLSGLILWEAGYGLQFVALEFFFRGFLLFTLSRYIGAYAIFAMVVPYSMIHFTKPMAEALGAIVTGTALGTLALRTRSIFGGVLLHTTIAWSMDLFALYQKGILQRLLP
jgi:membrane protease YdiL (CAAX protease family)